ncbi:hypothetical protein lerEdw1_007134 [Lerista edwardsae]|nr:hypothetical protein lerEdw1_007134 [Lerista edwardsae]
MYSAGSGSPPASPAARKSRGSLGSFPGLVSGNKNNKTVSFVGKKDVIPVIYGANFPVSSLTHQTSQPCGLEYDGSSDNTFHSPEDKIATGVLASALYKYCSDSALLQDHYKAAMEQLAALSLPKSTRTVQLNPNSSKQGAHHSWSYIHNQGSNAKSRDVKKSLVEMPSSSSANPINVINTSPVLLHSSVNRYNPVSYCAPQKTTLENYFTNGDGDFLKKANETAASHPAMDSGNDDMPSAVKWNSKRRNSKETESKLLEEKNASENEKRSDILLKYLRNMNLNLRPDPMEHKEDISSSLEGDTTFSYPDFLPSPYNTLDLQKLSVLKWDDWKLAFNPPLEESLDKLISRLVEMERLQHLTILRERTRDHLVSPTMAVNSRASSSRDVYQLRQLRLSDFARHQAALEGTSYSLGSYVRETDVSRCTCQHCRSSKGSSGGSSSVRSSKKHFRGSCNTFKGSRAPVILDSSNVLSRRSLSCSGSSSSIRSAVKMTSSKLLSPSMPTASSLPDTESSKYKQPRTKRKTCRKNIALMGKPFHSQRLKSLSVISKQKYSHVDSQ